MAITSNLRHLRVAEFLVHNDSFDELCVLQFASHFTLHFNQLKVNIFPLHVSNCDDGIYCNLSHLPVAPVDTGRE